MPDKKSWSIGHWQAHVTQAGSRYERNKRLEEVPISMRQQVRRHVETVLAIKKYHKSVAKRKSNG